MVASDRISTYDVVHPTAIPDKGKVLTGLSVLWFDLTKDIVANHLISAHRRRAGRAPRPRAARAEAPDAAGRVRRARLHLRLRLEGLPGDRPRLGDRAARRACASPTACRSRSTRPRRRPTRATTRRSTSSRRSSWPARASWPSGCATRRSRSTRRVADHALERGVILADTKFEFGLDEDGELVLGDEVCTPDSSRFWPADQYEPGKGQPLVRQAVRARLGGRHGLGQDAAGAGDPRRRRRGRRASAT